MMRLPPGKNLAVNEPTGICPGCQEEGGWVLMKHLPGRWHVRCGLKADYLRQSAEKGQYVTEVPAKAMERMERYARRIKRVFGRD